MNSLGSDPDTIPHELQLTHLVERVLGNFDEKRLTGAVFLDVTKAFDTVWVDGLLYKHIPQFSFVTVQNHSLLPEWTDVRSVLPNSHIH
jgi:hypothetical protein